MYNVRYLLKNCILNCRISENLDPSRPIREWGSPYAIIQASSFRYYNSVQLKFDNITNFYEVFDGRSFLLEGNTPQVQKNMQKYYVGGFTDVQFKHTFNVFFKLSEDANGIQDILSYGSDFGAGGGEVSNVRFRFTQIGDTDQFTPLINTYINNAIPYQDFLPNTNITRGVWYFYSFQRDTVTKTLKLSVNRSSFQTQSYIDEMIIQTHRIALELGTVMPTPFFTVQNCNASFGNFS